MVEERKTYFGRSRNGQLSVSSLSDHWLSSQESVGKAAIKQPHDGETWRDAADELLTPTSSSLSLSEPTLHRLWLDDSFWFWPEPWFGWGTQIWQMTERKVRNEIIKYRALMRNGLFNVQNQRGRRRKRMTRVFWEERHPSLCAECRPASVPVVVP